MQIFFFKFFTIDVHLTNKPTYQQIKKETNQNLAKQINEPNNDICYHLQKRRQLRRSLLKDLQEMKS